MRRKINHISLGWFYESYFVCNTETEAFVREVIDSLAYNANFKAGVFVYDKEPLTPTIQKRLKHCYSVIFMLTPGVVEASAKDQSLPFYKVYSLVEKHNPNASSLVAVDGCDVDYTIEYPPGMKSFYFLHRKNFYISHGADAVAAELCKELRKNYPKKQQRLLSSLSCGSCYLHEEAIKPFLISTLCALASMISCFVFLNTSDTSNIPGLVVFLMLLALVLGGIGGVVIATIGLSKLIFDQIMLFDMSQIFSDFKRRTVIRALVIFTIIANTALFSKAAPLINANDYNLTILLPISFAINLLLLAHTFILSRCCYNSTLYIHFAKKRLLVNLIFLPIYIISIALIPVLL